MTSLQQKQQDAQLIELLGFLTDPQPQVRRIALASLLPYTAADKRERSLFNRDHYIEQIATMCADQELIAHDALSVLINLTSSIIVADRLAKIPGFLTGLVRMIIDENALLSDLACMLLSNLSKLEHVSMQLLGLRVPFNVSNFSKATDEDAQDDERPSKIAKEGETDGIEALELLLEVFLKGEGKRYNPNANYDFLASVFANVSTIPLGRSFLLSTTSPDAEPPLVALISFTEHPSTIRRGGVASCIKSSSETLPSKKRDTRDWSLLRMTSPRHRDVSTSCRRCCCHSAGPKSLTLTSWTSSPTPCNSYPKRRNENPTPRSA
ncbi:hypothetical protein, variant 2 [Microbotryum lychnidis-dioicae p1A1 Lamole]|uniref:Protein HGH1 N-terminal domain-containing protein n=1 Tax=Microbotryum lychnidis-dioicae (strain p1A1 Lamole / MvSl-1064) TaxID=683840 RepID=U5GY08_USTV1|nr:hypothetical protein, variant 2 [Microbotryum lychnidis-dioicae p1A1 Lamole]|eukprot:KDE09677.1 hypothetical protein, variant 2 [Microbotryum lychnidis-dioicae p1A1 Lamole]